MNAERLKHEAQPVYLRVTRDHIIIQRASVKNCCQVEELELSSGLLSKLAGTFSPLLRIIRTGHYMLMFKTIHHNDLHLDALFGQSSFH